MTTLGIIIGIVIIFVIITSIVIPSALGDVADAGISIIDHFDGD